MSVYNAGTHSENQKKYEAENPECEIGQPDLIDILKYFVQVVYDIFRLMFQS